MRQQSTWSLVTRWVLYFGLIINNLVLGICLAATESPADMRVLIDVSGSMKQNDPDNLRVPAVKLLLNLAPNDSQLGVWTFGRYVNNLVPSAKVSQQWKQSVSEKAEDINSVGLFTDIGAALEQATKDPSTQDEKTIVLLSDGMVDISKDPALNEAEKQRILTELAPQLKADGFRVHAVALSDSSDKEFLEALARATNGDFAIAASAEDLMPLFVEASDEVNQPEQVPMEDNRFSIDPSVKEFTALIYRKKDARPTQLVTPSGDNYSAVAGSRNINWYADPHYDLITVYNPEPGEWRAMADLAPGNRVTIIADLTLDMSGLPDQVVEGEQLTMELRLKEEDRTITNPKFLKLMDITFSQQTEAGDEFKGKLAERGNPDGVVPADGVYSAKLGRTIIKGKHKFTVMVDGQTFSREKSLSIQVHKEVLKVETAYREVDGEIQQYLNVEPKSDLIRKEQLNLIAQIVDPKGEKVLQDVTRNEQGDWQVEVPPFGALGEYQVLLKLNGTTVNDHPFELFQGPFMVDYSPIAGAQTELEVLAPEQPLTEIIEEIDPSLTEIPSLDVKELPPEEFSLDDHLEPEPEVTQIPTPVAPVPEEPLVAADEVQSEEEGSSWLLIAAIGLLNLLVVGLGLFFYLRFNKNNAAQQSEVEQELAKARSEPIPASDELAVTTGESKAEEVADSAAAMASAAEEPAAPALPDLEEEATVINTDGAQTQPEETYINEAEPLELEDDSVPELDDDDLDDLGDLGGFGAEETQVDEPAAAQQEDPKPEAESLATDDSMDDEIEGLEDLDMMLSEQEEEAALENDDNLNQTIDEMLEQPTEFPDLDDIEDQATDPKSQDEDEDFANDDFMLDDPGKK